MKMILSSIVFALMVVTQTIAADFYVKDFDVRLSTPKNWRHDPDDLFGYVIYDTNRPKGRVKFRIHRSAPQATTPEEQAKESLDTINARRAGKHPLEIIRYQRPIITRSGISGYVSSHGFDNAKDTPYIDHYYFKSPSGVMFCICAYSAGDSNAAHMMESIIKDTLNFTTSEKRGEGVAASCGDALVKKRD